MADWTTFPGTMPGGDFVAQLARQFALPPDAVKRALEVAMPTLAQAAQRQFSDPKALSQWLALMLPPNRAPSASPQTADPARAGAEAIGRLFGSADVTDAVAAQVAATTGLGQAVTTAMLPWAAIALASGLAAATKPGSEPQDLAKSIEPLTARVPNPIGPNSFFDETFGAFVRGYNRGRPKAPPEPPKNEFDEMLAAMVDAGRQAQAAHQQAVEEILDRLMGRPKR